MDEPAAGPYMPSVLTIRGMLREQSRRGFPGEKGPAVTHMHFRAQIGGGLRGAHRDRRAGAVGLGPQLGESAGHPFKDGTGGMDRRAKEWLRRP
jgi:hypothetical protein